MFHRRKSITAFWYLNSSEEGMYLKCPGLCVSWHCASYYSFFISFIIKIILCIHFCVMLTMCSLHGMIRTRYGDSVFLMWDGSFSFEMLFQHSFLIWDVSASLSHLRCCFNKCLLCLSLVSCGMTADYVRHFFKSSGISLLYVGLM